MVYLSESHFPSRNIFGKKRSGRFKEKCEWFDDECRKQKTLLNNVRRSYQPALKMQNNSSIINVADLKLAYFQQHRNYKKILRKKRKNFLDNEKLKLWSLKGEAPKVFWQKLKCYDKRNRFSFSNNANVVFPTAEKRFSAASVNEI